MVNIQESGSPILCRYRDMGEVTTVQFHTCAGSQLQWYDFRCPIVVGTTKVLDFQPGGTSSHKRMKDTVRIDREPVAFDRATRSGKAALN